MTALDLPKLRALAEAATPGEWMLWTSCSWRRFGLTDHTTLVMQPIRSPSDGHPDLLARQEDLDYIAAFHPATALALLDELERLRGWERAHANLLDVAGIPGMPHNAACLHVKQVDAELVSLRARLARLEAVERERGALAAEVERLKDQLAEAVRDAQDPSWFYGTEDTTP